MNPEASPRPWDAELLDAVSETSLVAIGRDRRLVLDEGHGPKYVDLCWVDEVALALIDLALAEGRGLDIVYPAPAGQVAVLVAAELLVRQLLEGVASPSVGIVTGDTTMAARVWNAIAIANPGARASLSDVFPCFRALPDGTSPLGGRRFRGMLVGQRCSNWPVDTLVVDHLSGPVRIGEGAVAIEVFSNPLDGTLREAEAAGHLIWGWSNSDVARFHTEMEVRRDYTVPFSVTSGRLDAIARGVAVRVRVARHPDAEAALARAREDLRLLRSMSPERSDPQLERGLSVAWHHLSTLVSLPCTPDRFDRYSGLPPWAARATNTFAREIAAWATTLSGEAAEFAGVLASDIDDLRAALDRGNPLETELRDAAADDVETIVVTRTRTAARALMDALGGDPTEETFGCLTICPVSRLHREGTWPRALFVGDPAPWDWDRVLSGLSTDVCVLALGQEAGRTSVAAAAAARAAGEHWGSVEVRGKTWRALLGSDPPTSPPETAATWSPVMVVDGSEYVPEPDPFGDFASLFELTPFEFGGEGPRSTVAREGESGGWEASAEAFEVQTDHGRVYLEADRPIEIRVGPKIVDRRPEQLSAGDVLLVGRREGRVGLMEALEERLQHRQDLLVARLLIDNYWRLLRATFTASGLSVADLHRRVGALGCTRTSAAVRDWVTAATMAPQRFEDLEYLAQALELAMSPAQLRDLFAAAQRRRGFRRAAGRALAAAARTSTAVEDDNRVDPETGLAVADLRDAVVEAVVESVSRCATPLPVALLGRLEET